MQIKKILCKSAMGKCGFPSGGLAINPYVGCHHGCVYCYARFMKRFTGHAEDWGDFVDVKSNIVDILKKQLESSKYLNENIFIGTVTDPYQPVEKDYELTRGILKVLSNYDNPVSILTKSDRIIRDIALLKKIRNIDINFTINTLDEKWRELTEPNASTIKQRFGAIGKLAKEDISVSVMMGPYWPIFTNPTDLFREFKRVGVNRVFTESLNTIGGNWTGVEKVLKSSYPSILSEMRTTLLNENNFNGFYAEAKNKTEKASREYGIPVTIYFGLGHAGKFKQTK